MTPRDKRHQVYVWKQALSNGLLVHSPRCGGSYITKGSLLAALALPASCIFQYLDSVFVSGPESCPTLVKFVEPLMPLLE